MTYNFIKHTADVQPISDDAVVVYRTISNDETISHVHMPIRAAELNWTNEPDLGRIYEYAITSVKKATIVDPDKYAEQLPLSGFCG